MRLALLVLICLFAVVACTSSVLADKYAAEFLKVGPGARALGMGGAFVALADDASAVYWNPAGLADIRERELEAMHAEQFGDVINYDFVAVALPLSRPGEKRSCLGAAIIRLAVDDIPYTKNMEWEDFGVDGVEGTFDEGEGNGKWEPGERILFDEGKIVWKNNADVALLLSYAAKFTDRLSVGATFKLVRQELMDNSSLGAGADIGATFELNSSASLGVVVSDATTTQLAWDSGHHEFVAPMVRMGGQYTKHFGPFEGGRHACPGCTPGLRKKDSGEPGVGRSFYCGLQDRRRVLVETLNGLPGGVGRRPFHRGNGRAVLEVRLRLCVREPRGPGQFPPSVRFSEILKRQELTPPNPALRGWQALPADPGGLSVSDLCG
ncbi:MAG: UPF0164 family protein [Candidatus Eisenbacteria bacterium]